MQNPVEEILHKRHSLRRYAKRQPERGVIDACLEAARIAPSAQNSQLWRFHVIDDPALRDEIALAATGGVYLPSKFIREAPVIIAALAKTDIRINRIGTFLQGVQFYLFDLGVACQQLVLRAEELGLGSCYIGWFDVDAVRRLLTVPKNEHLVCLLALGYPPEGYTLPGTHKRKELHTIARYNRE
ncbi:MAG: nitroreductase family protein [Spirochaetota bacterium]|jgi:nitroreductase|nr:nitroreductase family protein [Spirochaetota bacterium]